MKKRKISRLMAILCALALMLTLSPAASAATPFVSENIKVNSIVNLPAAADIRVKSNLYVNPQNGLTRVELQEDGVKQVAIIVEEARFVP